MMTTNRVRGELRLAADIGFTRLPFGGGVLLNRRTLAIAECDEREAENLARLLALLDTEQTQVHTDTHTDAVLDGMAAQLLEAGWLIAVPERR
jgi:hypothetical protein